MPSDVIKFDADKIQTDNAEQVQPDPTAPRSFLIMREDLNKHGFTSGCAGCRATMRGAARQAHSIKCLDRLAREMKGDNKVKKAKEKEAEFIVGMSRGVIDTEEVENKRARDEEDLEDSGNAASSDQAHSEEPRVKRSRAEDEPIRKRRRDE